MREDELTKLLDRFEKGECYSEELSRLEAWFDRSSASGEFRWSEQEKSIFNTNLKKRIDATITDKVRSSSINWLKVAASVILIAAFSLLLNTYRTTLIDYFDPVIYAQTIVPMGQKVKLTLSDGSVVVLNGGSRLRYPEKFNRNVREVILIEGEAYFDVAHNKEKPFIIEAGGTKTQVLGTAFNIRSYAGFKNVEVTVSRGKVAVSKKVHENERDNLAPVFLLPNEQVSIDRLSWKMKKRNMNAREVISWTQGKLIFNNESLKNVAVILQHSYGIKINYKNTDIEEIRFTASFDQHDTLDEILYSIAKANKLRYLKHGKNVLFSKKYNPFN
jgi:transmembrane sensor